MIISTNHLNAEILSLSLHMRLSDFAHGISKRTLRIWFNSVQLAFTSSRFRIMFFEYLSRIVQS